MLYAIVVVLVLIADQLVKYWVTANITLNSGSVELIPGILKLVNIHNDGAAFSLFPGYRWIFVGLAAAVTIAVILALIFHWIKSGFGRWMAVLTMAGALGNAIDRAIYGYVVDMFVIEPVKFIQVFNVADIFITVGGILFCLYLIISGGRYQVKRVASPDGKPTAKAPLEELEPAEEIPVAIAEDEEPVPTEEVEETLDDEPTEEEPEDAPVVPESEPEDEEVTEDEEEETSEEYSLASDESTEEESEEEAAPEEEEPAPVEEVVPEEEAAPDQEAALEEESETDEETVPEEDLSREEPAPAEEEYLEEPTQMEMDLDPEPEEVVPAEEPEELPAAEPETEPVESETEEEFSFTLEDILNEFR